MTALSASRTRTVACGPAWHWLAPAAEMAAATGAWLLPPGQGPSGRAGSPQIATRTPGSRAGSLHAAREFAAATLDRWQVCRRGDDIVVVVSELLTNAVRHALPDAAWYGQPIRFGLLHPGPYVLCAVADPSGRPPVVREPGGLEENGRGLQVVRSLSDEWGWTAPTPRGKVVWAMFATGPLTASW